MSGLNGAESVAATSMSLGNSGSSGIGDEGAGPYCGRCGQPLNAPGIDHHGCAEALELEPPRYCTVCRRRMVVQVEPTEWFATCSRHGRIDGTNATVPSVNEYPDEVSEILARRVPGLDREQS